ncbi:hypothetical protein [Devosia sp. A16]|uniref:hypothetical protein n=1 Tax=Devosia sp. A16 TaxID=1736675 RepID=UPI000B044F42|nr:hypothetical protein [Devosia sp. A16]
MHGLHILLVEEEYLIAADMEQTLRAAGASEVTIVANSASTASLDFSDFQLAIIEAKFGSAAAVALNDRLRAAGVAVVVTSADHAVQALFTDATPLYKPFDAPALLAACEAARRRDPSLTERA